jgi:uncharacterized protein YqjF (DUF2071 family)
MAKSERQTPLMEDWVQRQLIERQMPMRGRPLMFQEWHHLLFLHWAIEPGVVQQTLSKELQVDLFEGKAWIGVVPFFMKRIRPYRLPGFPLVSNFLELNFRTYVRDKHERPGIWFYSLDANQPLAVWGARIAFGLPYQHALMRAKLEDGWIDYRSRRKGKRFHCRYRPMDRLGEAVFGSFEFFLVERYRLFALLAGGIRTARVYHTPYQLSQVETTERETGALFELNGFEQPTRPPDHVIYSERVDVTVYGPESGGLQPERSIAALP